MDWGQSCFDCLRVFFFFKQKTAYEMRISDWSSDVCSSDLLVVRRLQRGKAGRGDVIWLRHGRSGDQHSALAAALCIGVPGTAQRSAASDAVAPRARRSEARRVGKECVSTGRSRWSPHHVKNNTADSINQITVYIQSN